jgi:solute carrier family 26 (sodium-independent sulfate anion transporter), member 11
VFLLQDRPWNDPGPRRGEQTDLNDDRPILRAVVLDCSSINYVDVTSMQALIDTRNQFDQHAYPETVEWHVANLNKRWTRRAFAAAGFGYPHAQTVEQLGQWKPIFSVAGRDEARETLPSKLHTPRDEESGPDDIDKISGGAGDGVARAGSTGPGRMVAIQGVNRPYFHIDVAAAVESVVSNIESKLAREKLQ